MSVKTNTVLLIVTQNTNAHTYTDNSLKTKWNISKWNIKVGFYRVIQGDTLEVFIISKIFLIF